ncbi:ABC transporter ATP-binding protein, partial [Enterococcus sp. S181_ASV_20]|nr:ABC transporter ATP-binding protein [Enterococcus sp. S181_ASV_20]
FNIWGPKILSKAITELFNGLIKKYQGTGDINFDKIGGILLFMLGLYVVASLFGIIQGWIMSTISQKITYRMRKEISEKINRMPMNYFESRTTGEVLSRITNDVQ